VWAAVCVGEKEREDRERKTGGERGRGKEREGEVCVCVYLCDLFAWMWCCSPRSKCIVPKQICTVTKSVYVLWKIGSETLQEFTHPKNVDTANIAALLILYFFSLSLSSFLFFSECAAGILISYKLNTKRNKVA